MVPSKLWPLMLIAIAGNELNAAAAKPASRMRSTDRIATHIVCEVRDAVSSVLTHRSNDQRRLARWLAGRQLNIDVRINVPDACKLDRPAATGRDCGRSESLTYRFRIPDPKDAMCLTAQRDSIQSDLKVAAWMEAVAQTEDVGSLDAISHQESFSVISGQDGGRRWRLVSLTADPGHDNIILPATGELTIVMSPLRVPSTGTP
jgi:hypothetical protein